MRDNERRISELREALLVDPAGEACVELARLLIEDPKTRAEAREVLFTGIARDPHLTLGRLLLARSFYLDDMMEFSVRELFELQKYTDVPSLQKLIDSFGAFAMAYRPRSTTKADKQAGEDAASDSGAKADEDEDILAEIDLDDEFLDAIDELDS